MKCVHCGHEHINVDGQVDIDHCMQCVWAIRHKRKHGGDVWEFVCKDFDH